MKIAVVHDWLTGMRGGESVLEAILELYPQADLFTLIHKKNSVSSIIENRKVMTSFLQKIPKIEKKYRYFLPIMPKAIETFDLSPYDLIISSSHCVAKGVRKRSGAKHISYVHAPMRYVWDRYEDYFSKGVASLKVRVAARLFRGFLKSWDYQSARAEKVDILLANSRYIANQIETHYQRRAYVVHPFVDLERFKMNKSIERKFYLILSAFVPYKKIDLAIKAFNELKLPLMIIGSGADEARLKKLANNNIVFLGSLSNEEVCEYYQSSKAFIFPGLEDFGITPLESLASGTPVIAYQGGGVLDTLTEKTGIFFKEQTVQSLKDAVLKFENKEITFSPEDCRKRAELFSKENFKIKFLESIQAL